MTRLTAKEVDAIHVPGRYAVGDDLYLEVKPNLGKSWLYRYQFQGKRTQLGLGGVSKANTLAVARAKALEMASLVAKEIDPKKHKDESKRQAAAELDARKQALGLKKNTFEKVAYLLDYLRRVLQSINLGSKPISERRSRMTAT